ncbi:hypothetical protein F2P56_002211 [Juglans regia]|uniref:Uncharacterized protein LOC108993567 n=2 Tax=Juglans regia TaxID=51240 RepID=A0A2I4EXF7_JUGRE|nr:uncharacterized protein LOC108993567 [Juglans regia]KAF5481570.1 hypothetical protein F2P56_002211 [Juglans regia]
MDWLSQHYAKIDCRRNEVSFDLPAKDKIYYLGERVELAPLVVSTCQIKRNLREGATAYLLVMTSETKELKGAQGIPVIEDFPRVFADELPGLPQDREKEFTIELKSETAPMHKVLYRMALTELKELKDQIEELLEKRFI